MHTFRVFLKTGGHFDVWAHHWDVVNYEFQESDHDDPPRRQITAETVGFYDDNGNDVSPDWFIPFDQVAAIVSSEGNLLNSDGDFVDGESHGDEFEEVLDEDSDEDEENT
jgi:hypothetical protein